ncbi:hypothetical protein ACIRS1_11515 [Kitasatospora sp. NPDC101176]|uniref:Rv1733c family protein n=1 Tax=Kitasatospora sp. NPDC101176 TaxID=3364099 RepID=UPI00380D92C5
MPDSPRPARPASPLRRTGRRLRWALGAGTDPLLRPVDRARSRAWLATLLGALLALALTAGGALVGYRTAVPRADADRGLLRVVDAVVLSVPEDHRAVSGSRFGGRHHDRVDVEARWTSPDGVPHTGTVQAPRATTAGSVLPVWVDRAGEPTGPPLDRTAIAVSAACTGLGALLALLALLVLALRLRLHTLERRTDEAWSRDWARLEPLWSGRAGHRQDD